MNDQVAELARQGLALPTDERARLAEILLASIDAEPASEVEAAWQKAAVALANKNARILWAVMTQGGAFDARHVSVKPGGVPAPVMVTGLV